MESLVALKAELQRKRQQQQQNAAERGPGQTKLKFKTAGSSSAAAPAAPANKGVRERDAQDIEQQQQDAPTADSAKDALARKAVLYQKLQAGVAALQDDELNNTYLVNFQKKIVDTVMESRKAAEVEEKEDPLEWVQFTDSLGRSREVRRGELKDLEDEDRYLRGEDEQTPLDAVISGAADPRADEVTDLQDQFEDQQRDEQRQRWEQQEQLNATKEDVHYQDVMFNEARTHGTGFVPLSGDRETRQEQQQLLRDLHDSSKAAAAEHRQQQRQQQRSMSARLLKIRQRKRLKRGLPMIDSDALKTPPASDDEDDQASSPTEAPTAMRLPSSSSIREWDVGKQIIGKFVEPADKDPHAFGRRNLSGDREELTQEAWVNKQRKARNEDFAPPSYYDKSVAGRTNKGESRQGNSTHRSSEDHDREQRAYNERHTDSAASNYIVNECSGTAADTNQVKQGKSYDTSSVFIDYNKPSGSHKRQGAEIAPPATFDYYGPASKRTANAPLFEPKRSMEDAINKGLKQFRDAM